ncbi:MAG: hypothetical protein EXS13_11400 [Planctomycetes bacterium]|nr:hypothetical protein [Planctomycetota bacterium]
MFLAIEAAEEIELVDVVLERLRARAKRDASTGARAKAPAPAPERDPWIGKKLGDFVLLERVGRGAMGLVFKARQASLQRDAAVKILPFEALSNANQVTRFDKEARVAARLRHPHLDSVFAAGCDHDVHWFAMELVDGPDRAREIKRLRGEVVDGAASPSYS